MIYFEQRYAFRDQTKSENMSSEILQQLIETKINHDCIFYGGNDAVTVYTCTLTDDNMTFLAAYFNDKPLTYWISPKRNIINIQLNRK